MEDTPVGQPTDSTPGGGVTQQLSLMSTPSNTVPPRVRADLIEVRTAIEQAGGLISQKPPNLEDIKPRIGQTIEVCNETLDIGEQIQQIVRPAEHTLHKLTSDELLPPPSTEIVPLEYIEDPDDYEFVQERSIEFLVMSRRLDMPTAGLFFLEHKQLQELFDFVRTKNDHIEIMDTVRWIRVDKSTEISSMMLSTRNYQLFKRIRHAIRVYTGLTGHRVETYEKAEFVKKYGLTMYVPSDNANLTAAQLIRTLFYKYPELYTPDIVLLCRTTFDKDLPDKPKEKRSRIGDRILLFDSPTLSEKLRPYSDDKKFFLNKGFSVTLKGGVRGNAVSDNVSPNALSKIIKSAAAEAMANAEKAAA